MAKATLIPIIPSASTDADTELILIPGPESRPIVQWGILSPDWQAFLNKTKSKVRLLVYDCNTNFPDSFSWPSLLGEGKPLLDLLREASEESKSLRFLSFMCHGLGGFILKQALCIANAQPERYATVLKSIIGIIFLGVQHAASTSHSLPKKSLLLLRSTQITVSKQRWSRLEKESDCLLDISRLFDDIRLTANILSVFETKETKVKVGFAGGKGLFASSRKLILVGEEAAKTNCFHETMLGLSCDHTGLSILENPTSSTDSELEKWLAYMFGEECRRGVEHKLRHHLNPPSPISMTSMASYDAARKALTDDVEKFCSAQTRSMEPAADSSGLQGWDVIPLVNGFSTIRRLANLPCFMMETFVPNKDFFPREDITAKLDQALLPPQMSFSSEPVLQRHAVLCGLGGLGKTSIAVEFAFSRKNNFDAVFWISADSLCKLDQGFCKIAGILGLEDESEPQNPIISRALAKGWLESPRKVLDKGSDIVGQADANWLLIFDNADNPDILQDYWPISSNGSILVTSRDPRSKQVPSIISNDIDVPLLDDEEAAAMLRKLSRVSKDSEASLKIAKRLGGLPLAISQMAAIIQHQYLSFAELLERYEDDEDRRELQGYEAGAPRQGTRGNVATIWFVDQLDSISRTLLEVCAMLDRDCIQERVLLDCVSRIKLLEAYPTTRSAFFSARAELIKRSLVSRNEGRREFWVHRVLQDSVLSKMSESRIHAVFSTAVQLVLDAWGPVDLAKRHDIELSRSRAGLFPHALNLKAIFQRHDFLRDRNTTLRLGRLMNEAGWWQHERGNSHDVKSLFLLAEEICEQFPGEKATQLQCDVHYGLAAIANETNDKDTCLQRTKHFLEMRLEIYDGSGIPDLRLAIAYNEHAIALVMTDDLLGAVDAFTRSIEVFKSLETYWPGLDTNPRTNISFVFWALGRLEDAFTMLHELLMDRETRFGIMDKESFRTGRVLKGLANVTWSQGRYAESEEFARRALKQWQGTIGSNHHKTADGCIGFARHCMRRADFDDARKLLDQALRIYELTSDVYRPQIARTLFIKARLAMLTGLDKEGTKLFKEARNVRNEIQWAPKKADSELTEVDFEALIVLWSR